MGSYKRLFALMLACAAIFNAHWTEHIEEAALTLESIVQTKVETLNVASLEPRVLSDESTHDIAAVASPAVVRVSVYEELPRRRVKISTGSGFFVTSDGYIVTNKHVVSELDATFAINVTGTSEVPARVVYRDPSHDLAILKIAGNDYPTITLGNSSDIRAGDSIVGIGNALGKRMDSISRGTIVGVSRTIAVHDEDDGVSRLRGLIQTNAKLYPGDSGGPLLNARGEAIGVNVATAVGESIGYSIPINVAKRTLEQAGILAS